MTEHWHTDYWQARDQARLVNNLVIMGMGEPLAILRPPAHGVEDSERSWGGGLGAQNHRLHERLAPQIRQLAQEPLQFHLAISLHGATTNAQQNHAGEPPVSVERTGRGLRVLQSKREDDHAGITS